MFAIFDSGFRFDPGLVPGHFAFGLVGQQPTGSVLAQAQQFAAFSQPQAGQIIQSVAFVSAPGHLTEAGGAQPPRQGANVVHAKLDLDFFRHD